MTMELYPEMIMRPGWICVVLLLSIVLRGCGTGGHLITPEQLARLTMGTTTQQHVQNHLGEPKAKCIFFETGREYTKWSYFLTQYSSDPQTGVPPIGMTQVPISRANTQTTEVEIIFDQNGIVTAIQEKIQRGGP